MYPPMLRMAVPARSDTSSATASHSSVVVTSVTSTSPWTAETMVSVASRRMNGDTSASAAAAVEMITTPR